MSYQGGRGGGKWGFMQDPAPGRQERVRRTRSKPETGTVLEKTDRRTYRSVDVWRKKTEGLLVRTDSEEDF